MSPPVPIALLHGAGALSPRESVQDGVGPALCPFHGWPRECAELGQLMAKVRAPAGEAPSGTFHHMHGWGRNGGWSMTSAGCR